jgi:signal recognition particle subunit SRP19
MATAAPIQLVSLSRRERGANVEVGSFSKTKKHSDKPRWVCVYPAYLNSKRTLAQGRKLPAKLAVENPTIGEIRDVLVNAGLQVELEVNKVHPKELNKYEMLSRGRVRVHLKNDDGTPLKPNLPTRNSINSHTLLLYYIINRIQINFIIFIYN